MKADPIGRPESYTVHLENFEGPLDLLLHLIRREEMNIYDIPIARITEQYLAIIQDLVAQDIDRASEFLVMAATLLGIKSRMLLPKPPKLAPEEALDDAGDDPREELVRQLVAYSQYKEAAQDLRERETEMARVYTRTLFVEEPSGPRPLEGLNLDDLVKAFKDVLRDEWNWREVPREEIPLRDRIRELNFRLARSPHGLRFRELFTRGGTRLEVIITFLALLELIKQQKAMAVQEGTFGDIVIRRVVPNGAATTADQEDDEA